MARRKNLKKQIDELLANRPQYEISDEYGVNQALATNAAFGRDRAIQGQESNIEQESADAVGLAQNYSSSASSILNTIASITGSKNQALRNLAVDEASIQRQKLGDLYGANIGMAEEQDKAFDYNVNQPYQNKIQELRDRRKNRQESIWKILDTIASVATFGRVGSGGRRTSVSGYNGGESSGMYGQN